VEGAIRYSTCLGKKGKPVAAKTQANLLEEEESGKGEKEKKELVTELRRRFLQFWGNRDIDSGGSAPSRNLSSPHRGGGKKGTGRGFDPSKLTPAKKDRE